MMNHLVRIEQRTNTPDSVTGEFVEAWTTFSQYVPCRIEPLSANTFIQSRADQSGISVRITLPFLPGLDHTMRLVGLCDCHIGKIYNPAGILEDNITGRDHITIPCSQGVNSGA